MTSSEKLAAKAPDVRGTAERDPGNAPGTVGLRSDLAGYALHLSWICLLFYNVAPNAIGAMQTISSPVDPLYMISMLAMCLTLAVGIATLKPFMRVAESRVGTLVAPVVTAVGTLAYCVELAGHAPSFGMLAIGGVLTGFGSAVMAARWASVLGAASSRAFVANLPVMLTVTALLCMTTSYLPDVITYAVVTLLPLAAGVWLQYARTCQRRRERRPAATMATSARATHGRRTALLALLALFVALLGFTSGGLPRFASASPALAQCDLVFYLVATVLMLGFVGTLMFLDDRRDLVPLFVVPIALLVAFALPFSRYVTGSAIDSTYSVGQASFELMLMFGSVLFALLLDFSPARTYMVARVALALSDVAGSGVAAALMASPDVVVGIQAASVALLVASELVIVALVAFYLVEHGRRPSRPRECTAGGAARDVVAARDTPASEAHAAYLTQATGAGRANHIDGTNDLTDTPAAAAADVVTRLADEHDLSPRERDVLGLLVLGRTSARIQDELCISKGTLNYHMRNIYAKLGVHSRQELLLMALGSPVGSDREDA